MAFKEKMIPLLIQGSGSYICLIICFLIFKNITYGYKFPLKRSFLCLVFTPQVSK